MNIESSDKSRVAITFLGDSWKICLHPSAVCLYLDITWTFDRWKRNCSLWLYKVQIQYYQLKFLKRNNYESF